MEVTIRCYGDVADAVGAASLSRVLEPQSTVGDVVRGLAAEFDAFDPESPSTELVYRVNGGDAERTTRLADGDAVVLSERSVEE
ncbi:MoaD/ThiS family protein [Halogeometricum limi]|uniref:ThiS family protein n=1 Tax=Halogeometricum limi TaxID=555875 RepID=A0A1I6IK84_9EURY|nr:MoaD/ThiS family protein [Halogeometricum limi]SFR67113.1 ThiS family protein [Halogeometricum limi]